jgi:hypothetical protein
MEGFVSIKEFMDHLKVNDLVIVKRGELLDSTRINLELMQAEFLKRKHLSCGEIVKAQLLPLKSDEGVRHWIKNGRICEDEYYYTTTNRLRILTSAIKRLRNEN